MDGTFCFIPSFSLNDRLWAFSMLIHVALLIFNDCRFFFWVLVFLNQSPMGEHVGCFQRFAVTNGATVKILVGLFRLLNESISQDTFPEEEF